MDDSRHIIRPDNHPLPWYGWLLAPFVFPIALAILLPLVVVAVCSIPYFLVFPDHHKHIYDVDGTAQQRRRLAQWRAAYRRLLFRQRVARTIKLLRRRRNLSA